MTERAPHHPWSRPSSALRRAVALAALATIVVVAGFAATAPALPGAQDPNATVPTVAPTVAPPVAPPAPTQQTRLSTGKRINPAADDPAGLNQPTAPAQKEQTQAPGPTGEPAPILRKGDPGSEQLSGEPGVCGDGCGDGLAPVVECSFRDPGTGLYNTVWSYRGGRIPVKIPPGWFNILFPGKVDQGQPGVFYPGYHRNVFITSHKGPLTWVLGFNEAIAPGRNCGHNPVPMTGAGLSSIVTLFAVAGLLGIGLFVRGKRTRRRAEARRAESRRAERSGAPASAPGSRS